jgi:N4-gp56 family major capsid protein
MAPELPLQASEDLLSTPMYNLIHSFGADLHFAEAHLGKNTRLMRYERLSTDGGQLDGTGIDPSPEVPVRSDIDATTEIYAKTIVVNEQVELFENTKVLTKFTALLGQWLREKEDLLMRDLYASSVSYLNAVGGINGQQPSEISRNDINNIERLLLGNDARTILEGINADMQFATAGTRNAFVALASTDITPDLQNVQGVLLVNAYAGNQAEIRPEEYCSVSRFRFFVSSKAAKIPGISQPSGQTIYTIPMYGVEAAAKIEQNKYTARVGFRPDWVVSSVAQNCQLYAKFAIARAITNQNWVSGLRVTQRL